MDRHHRVLLVHSGDWLAAARLARLFDGVGIATTALTPAGTLLAPTNDVDACIEAPREARAFVDVVRRTVNDREAWFSFVLLADDAVVEAVGAHAGEPWLDRCFPAEHRGGAATLLTSKFAFLCAARRAGLPLPRFTLAATVDEACAAAAAFGYPVTVERQMGLGGVVTRRAENAAGVAAAFDAFGDAVVNVQELIDGIRGGSEVLYDQGRLVCSASFETSGRYSARFGASIVRRVVDPPGLDGVLEGCGRLTGFSGFATLRWQYDERRHRLALLEMNPRPGCGMHLVPGPAKMFAAGFAAMLDGRSATRRREPGTVPAATPRMRTFGHAGWGPWTEMPRRSSCYG